MRYVLIAMMLLVPPLLAAVAFRAFFGPVSRWPYHG